MPLPPAAAIKCQLSEPSRCPGKQTETMKRSRRGQRYASALAHRRRQRKALSDISPGRTHLCNLDNHTAFNSALTRLRNEMDTANTPPSVPDLREAAEQYQAAARSQLDIASWPQPAAVAECDRSADLQSSLSPNIRDELSCSPIVRRRPDHPVPGLAAVVRRGDSRCCSIRSPRCRLRGSVFRVAARAYPPATEPRSSSKHQDHSVQGSPQPRLRRETAAP
jgi:hypothetical protein